jgi:hypothetical protein
MGSWVKVRYEHGKVQEAGESLRRIWPTIQVRHDHPCVAPPTIISTERLGEVMTRCTCPVLWVRPVRLL